MNLIAIGLLLIILSCFLPVIYHYIFKKISTAGKFWTMYLCALIGIILIITGILL